MPNFRLTAVVFAALAPLVLTGCVKKSTHRIALDDLASAEAQAESLRGEVARLESEQSALRTRMDRNGARRDSIEGALRSEIVALEEQQRRVEARRQSTVEQFQAARAEVDRLQMLLSQRGTEYRDLQRRLDALRALEEEVRERNAIYEDMIARFRSLMDAGQLSVSIMRGRMVIQLPQDILFSSGSASLAREGQSVIAQVGRVLAEFPDRRFQVEGHTDNVPISTERFPSNWELSSARALAVVRVLTSQGVAPTNISGAAFGEYQPVAPNDDRESRRRNRRIEIVMLPNLDVIAETQPPGAR